MKLGFFTMPVHPQGRSYAETLKEDRAAFILADKLGYSEAYCGEHLTDACENIPNSMMFLASLVGATTQIKLGTAVANLPFSHPVVIASNAALLDNLLEGRFMLGIGAGVLPSDAEAMGLLKADRNAMMLEAIDQVLAIWQGEAPYNITGKFWNVTTAASLWPEIGMGPIVKPWQKPHPPIVGSVTDPNSKGIIALGARGWLPMTANYLHANFVRQHWTAYAEGCKAGGRKADPVDWRVARSIFVATDDKVAARYGKADADSPYRFYMSQLSAKLARGKRLGAFKREASMPDDAVTTDYVLDDIVIAGSVNSVVDQLLAFHAQSGDFGTLLYCGKNWTDPALGRKSMELMAEKVMPAVNAALRRSKAAE
jgi:alkanesulfonate monooxygenase SsuD/methylene tetrahydromethanopterin reductase-like flavin-dependent oxidoreductase (luciferase family)